MSLAQITFPETKENILKLGGLWDDGEAQKAEGMPSSELPDSIDDVTDDISTKPIVCPVTGMRYNIAAGELAFYREQGIPLPRRHGDFRTLERFGLIARMVEPREGKCCFCKKDIVHYFYPELGYQKIACTECYQKEVA